jgi:hypothetical protein
MAKQSAGKVSNDEYLDMDMVTQVAYNAIRSSVVVQNGGEAQGRFDTAISAEAFYMALAAIFESLPSVVTKKDMREAAQIVGERTLGYLQSFRRQYEASGEHILTKMGIGVVPDPVGKPN